MIDDDIKSDEGNSDKENRCSNPRKRRRTPEKWRHNEAKRKQAAGEEYISSKSQQVIAAVAQKEVHVCYCYAKLETKLGSIEARRELFSSFRKLDTAQQPHFWLVYAGNVKYQQTQT